MTRIASHISSKSTLLGHAVESNRSKGLSAAVIICHNRTLLPFFGGSPTIFSVYLCACLFWQVSHARASVNLYLFLPEAVWLSNQIIARHRFEVLLYVLEGGGVGGDVNLSGSVIQHTVNRIGRGRASQ